MLQPRSIPDHPTVIHQERTLRHTNLRHLLPNFWKPWLIVLAGLAVTSIGCTDKAVVPPEGVIKPEPRRYLGDSTDESATPKSGRNWWVDGTEASGIKFTYQNGRDGGHFTILESVGGGAALLDFDQDGDLDLFIPGGGSISTSKPVEISGVPAGLFRNQGDGKFTDVSDLVESNKKPLYSHGAFVADYNRDGYLDVLVTGYGGCRLLRNHEGQRFVDATSSAKLESSDWTTAAAWADADHDGWADLMIVGYVQWNGDVDSFCGDTQTKTRDVCPPQNYPGTRQRLFRNNRDGTFSEIPNAFGPDATGKGLGVVATDLNDDGWVDFYVANDQVANQLYLGGPNFPWQDVGVAAGVSGSEFGAPEGSMGVDAADYDGDGRPDLWVTNYELEDNSLYQNHGQNQFSHATVRAGLGGNGRPYVGFGTGFADFDMDGWLDLFVINGHVLYTTGRSAYLEPPILLHNIPSGSQRRFKDVSLENGGPWFQKRIAGRGAAVGDLDNDGDLDLVVVRQNEPVSILINQLQPTDWVRLDLRGTTSDPDAIGAVVRSQFDGREIVRHIRSGSGYLSQFDQRILLPAKDAIDITVTWPAGKTERFRNLKPRATHRIQEGMGESP